MWNAIKRLSRMYFIIFVHTHTYIYIDIAIIRKLESGGTVGETQGRVFGRGWREKRGKLVSF